MPSHSAKQAKVMSAIAHGWHPTGKAAGIPLKVAQEFHAADKGKKWGKHATGGLVSVPSGIRGTIRRYADGGDVAPQTSDNNAPDDGAGGAVAQTPQPVPGIDSPAGFGARPEAGWLMLNRGPDAVTGPTEENPYGRGWGAMYYDTPDNRGRFAGQFARGGAMNMHFPRVQMPFTPMRPFHMAMRAPGTNRQGFVHMEKGGFIHSTVPGRTDKHYVKVKEGSYVLPADHVSAVGQNNSIAGAEVIRKILDHGGSFGPRLKIPKFAGGGTVEPVPIVVAGGEVIIPPEIVKRIGKGDLERGHQILDKWVLATREKHIKKLESLKPPKGAKEK